MPLTARPERRPWSDRDTRLAQHHSVAAVSSTNPSPLMSGNTYSPPSGGSHEKPGSWFSGRVSRRRCQARATRDDRIG
jgi:hypothetical protein